MTTTTTSVTASNLAPFSAKQAHNSSRGTRIYTAATWLQSDAPNGHYQIEKLSPTMWVVTHHQVVAGGSHKIVRRVSGVAAKTKGEAIAQAEEDSHNLAENVMRWILLNKDVINLAFSIA